MTAASNPRAALVGGAGVDVKKNRKRPDLWERFRIDEADASIFQTHWVAIEEGRGPRDLRVRAGRRGTKERTRLARILIAATAGQVVDHVNGDTLDNRRCNLRVCSIGENSKNRRASAHSSEYKGVSFCSRSLLWRAVIKSDGKATRLGRYPTEEEAALAYDAAARRLHGCFASVNFPVEGEVGCRRNTAA